MSPVINLMGKRFGRLLVIGRSENDKHKKAMWVCRCDCGQKTTVNGLHIQSGRTQSCGCLRREMAAARQLIHGGTRKGEGWKNLGKSRREWNSWANMIQRCTNELASKFEYYGGRGINVCERWLDGTKTKHPFECFLADMGTRPRGKSLDRKNNDGDYTPKNCRWATASQQNSNRRRSV